MGTTRYQHQKDKRHKNFLKLHQVIKSLQNLQGEGYRPTAAILSEYTGISRQTLSKSVYREIWDPMYKEVASIAKVSEESIEYEQKDTVYKLEMKLKKMDEKLAAERKNKQKYKNELDDLKMRHKKLLFHNLTILRRLRLYGIEIEDIQSELDKFINKSE